MNREPLVTISVITYNSSKYVIETLESAKAQTYQKIELVISDDCSTDNTVEMCKKWVEDNTQRFVRCEIITSPVNTGVAANNNRAKKHSQGIWIKGIAGDDLLLPNCIEDNVGFVLEHPEVKVLLSNHNVLYEKTGKVVQGVLDNDFYNKQASEQFEILLYKCVPVAATAFIARTIFDTFKYNEMYRCIEDIPFWVNLTRNGVKLDAMDKVTVVYRKHESISFSNEYLVNPIFTNSCNLYCWNESLKYCREYGFKDAYNKIRQEIFLRDLADVLFQNKKTKVNSYLYILIERLVKRMVRFHMK